MTEQPGQPRGPRTGVYPGNFDPIHIIRPATLFDVAEEEHVVAVARLIGAAEPNEPEPNGSGPDEPGGGDPNEPGQDGPGGHAFSGGAPNEPELKRFGSNEPGGSDPNEPESSDASGLEPRGRASGGLDHD